MAERNAEQDFNIRHRLVGACVLLALGVIFIPMILQGKGPGVGKIDSQTEEVQDWIVGTEEADTYVSRVVPVGENNQSDPSQPLITQDNEALQLQAVEEADSNLDSPAGEAIQDKMQAMQDVAAVDAAPTPKPQESVTESPKPVSKIPAGIKAEDVSRGWLVQVGTFSKPENAQNLITKLNRNGFDSRYEVIDTDAGQATRVWVGPYEKRVTAGRALELVRENTGVKGFIKSYP